MTDTVTGEVARIETTSRMKGQNVPAKKLPAPRRLQEDWRIVSNREYEDTFDLESTRGTGTTQTAMTVADLIELGSVVNAKIAELLSAATVRHG
jgi:hypothetical protein